MLNKREKEYLAGRDYWSPLKPLALFYRHRLEEALARLLRREGLDLTDKTILEDGCGRGDLLRQLIDWGADAGRCYGVDISAPALEELRRRTAPVHLARASATRLPFRDGVFDVVAQGVLFSSLPPGDDRRAAAAEIGRVLKGGGALIWYDFVERAKRGLPQGLRLADVAALFPGWRMAAYKYGLKFRWALLIVNKSAWLAATLAALGIARSHYAILLRKPE